MGLCGAFILGLSPSAALGDGLALVCGQSRPGNIFLTSEPVDFPVQTSGERVEWLVRDFYSRECGRGVAQVGPGGRVSIRPGIRQTGYFELELTAREGASGRVGQAETSFAVVVSPREEKPAADQSFGVMTHFAQGWNVDLMPLIARAGLHHVRDEQYWRDVEPTKRGSYTFPVGYQNYFAAAATQGIEPLLALTFGNPLYDHDPAAPARPFAPWTDDGRAGYARYGHALLDRWGSQVKTVDVWNEYNGSFCAGPAAADRPRAYVAMLRAAYAELKATRSDVRVLGGAAVKVPLPWFEALFDQGALQWMDGVVIHPYRATPEGVEQEVAALQAMISRYQSKGAPPKEIWATECGSQGGTEPGRQGMARYLVRLLTILRASGVRRVYWYLFKDHQNFTSGLVRGEKDPRGRYTPTAAYPAYANLIRQLGTAVAMGRGKGTDGRTRLYLFRDARGVEIRVGWSVAGETELTLETPSSVTLVDIMGVERTLVPVAGTVRVRLDENTIYLRGQVTAVRETGRTDRLLADSAEDFAAPSGEIGLAPPPLSMPRWQYGTCAEDAILGGPAATLERWQPMTWAHDAWGYFWRGSDGLSRIDAGGVHPGSARGRPVWAVRRWWSASGGEVYLEGEVRCANTKGDGVGLRIFVDGREVHATTLRPGVEAATRFNVRTTVQIGSRIDFAVTPGPAADANFDATDFRVRISAPLTDSILSPTTRP